MTLTPEDIKRDAKAGTQGKWEAEGRNVYAVSRMSPDCNRNGVLAVIVEHPDNDWISHYDGTRIARLPALEQDWLKHIDALAVKDAEIERLREALEPFSVIAGEMFARNFNAPDKIISVGDMSLDFDDFIQARTALSSREGE